MVLKTCWTIGLLWVTLACCLAIVSSTSPQSAVDCPIQRPLIDGSMPGGLGQAMDLLHWASACTSTLASVTRTQT